MLYVKTKEELVEAINRKEKEFIVVGDLAKKLMPIGELKKLSKSNLTTLLSLSSILLNKATNVNSVLTGKEVIDILSAKKREPDIPWKDILKFFALLCLFGFLIIVMLKDYDFEFDIPGVHIKCVRNKKEQENNDEQEIVE